MYLAEGSTDELKALRQVLKPSAVFTHLTAAREFGWWLPPLPHDLPVFVSQLASEPRTRRRGVYVLRHQAAIATTRLGGEVFASPAEVLLACARHLALLDLVVLLDAALHRNAVTATDLEAIAKSGRAGTPALREALRYADGRSESPWGSVLRMLHRACDIDVEPQRDFFAANGMFVARADLWLIGTDTIHEYDGSTHLSVAGQRHDLARLRRLGDEKIVRRGYTAKEVMGSAHLILADADRSLGRRYEPERLNLWYRWTTESCFTKTGRERLRSRLGLSVGH